MGAGRGWPGRCIGWNAWEGRSLPRDAPPWSCPDHHPKAPASQSQGPLTHWQSLGAHGPWVAGLPWRTLQRKVDMVNQPPNISVPCSLGKREVKARKPGAAIRQAPTHPSAATTTGHFPKAQVPSALTATSGLGLVTSTGLTRTLGAELEEAQRGADEDQSGGEGCHKEERKEPPGALVEARGQRCLP